MSPGCETKDTGNNDMSGATTVVYLDRHAVGCADGKALKSWTVLSGGNGNGRVSYKCCDIPGYNSNDCTQSATGCTDNGKLQYLDRHNVDCGDNKVITNWHIQSCSGGQVKMTYRCCPVPQLPCGCVAELGFVPQ